MPHVCWCKQLLQTLMSECETQILDVLNNNNHFSQSSVSQSVNQNTYIAVVQWHRRLEKVWWVTKWQFFDIANFWQNSNTQLQICKRDYVCSKFQICKWLCKMGILRPKFCTFGGKIFRQKQDWPNRIRTVTLSELEQNQTLTVTEPNLNLNMQVRFPSVSLTHPTSSTL